VTGTVKFTVDILPSTTLGRHWLIVGHVTDVFPCRSTRQPATNRLC